MSKMRFDVVQEAFKKKAATVEAPSGKVSDYFGELVFNREKMFRYLDADSYEKVVDCIDNGVALDRKTADKVAPKELPKSTIPLWNMTAREV